ncbi:MAG: hypothetical protein OJF50_004268 [Nitrospira sp.]|nr:hypothetical protein [Nitrospira sp.]
MFCSIETGEVGRAKILLHDDGIHLNNEMIGTPIVFSFMSLLISRPAQQIDEIVRLLIAPTFGLC